VITDHHLVTAAQSGDSAALEELLARDQKTLYCEARRLTSNEDEAQNIVQDAMVRALVRYLHGDSQFATWLVSIVRNPALSKKPNVRWIYLDETPAETEESAARELVDYRQNPEQESAHQEIVRPPGFCPPQSPQTIR